MDREYWMYGVPRTSEEYLKGVDHFIQFAEQDLMNKGEDTMCCHCKDCINLKRFHSSDKVKGHLIVRGFQKGYTRWLRHGENYGQSSTYVNFGIQLDKEQVNIEVDDEINGDHNLDLDDNFDEMLHDIEKGGGDKVYEKLEKLYNDSEKPLFSGCTKFTKLSAVLKLYNLKASSGWSDKSFTSLLELLGDMLPDKNELPKSCYQAKKLLCPMGLEVERIHACSNDCILYRNEYENMHVCPNCGASRYKIKEQIEKNSDSDKKRPATKVVWYFPVISRFKRLFANSTDAKYLRWHSEDRKEDRKIRHPADSSQWRTIDRTFPDFGNEARNLRIGVSTDGMNPFGNMSSQHSTWPVLLCIYNLLPWLCMKRKYIMMSLLISGPKQPGNDIDVYLAPLIEDLKKLWCEGVQVYDAYSKENFTIGAISNAWITVDDGI